MEAAFLRSLIGVFIVLFAILAIFTVPAARKFTTKHFVGLFIQTYFCGFLLYVWGFWFDASGTILTSALRAAIASLEMFASHSELVEVNPELKEGDFFYMTCFSVIHFEALVLTLTFILEIFGKRLVSNLTVKRLKQTAKGKRLFLFDGADEGTVAFARSVKKDPKNVVVFVKGVVDPEMKEFSIMDALVKGVKARGAVDECDSLGYVVNTRVPLAVAMTNGEGWLYKKALELIPLYEEASVFFIAWESQMDSDAAFCLSNALPEGLKVRIYAGINVMKPHADKLVGCKYVVRANRSTVVVNHLFDSTPLLTEGKDKHTLILGFGHTAMNCLERLVRAGFSTIDVIDTEVGKRKEMFLCFNPKIRDMEGVRFYSYDNVRSNDYWAYLRDNIMQISNVIVFGKDDDVNYEKAVMIMRYAKSTGKDLTDFRIFMMENDRHPGDTAEHLFPFGIHDCLCDVNSISQIPVEK